MFLALTPGSIEGAIFQSRNSAGATTTTDASATVGVFPPYWLRLMRVGNQFNAFISPDGVTWTQVGTAQTIAMSSTVQIGLAVTASNASQLDVSHFQNVSITTAPNVTASAYLYNVALNQISFTFDEDVSASLLASSLTVSPGGIIASAVTWNGATDTATFTLPLPLNDGDYTATLNGALTTSSAGDAMTSDGTLPFFVLQGDTNRDQRVNALDFNALASNYGAPGPVTLAQGDVNYDGHVDSLDFTLLAQQFGAAVPDPGIVVLSARSFASTPVSSLFGSMPVNLADDVLA